MRRSSIEERRRRGGRAQIWLIRCGARVKVLGHRHWRREAKVGCRRAKIEIGHRRRSAKIEIRLRRPHIKDGSLTHHVKHRGRPVRKAQEWRLRLRLNGVVNLLQCRTADIVVTFLVRRLLPDPNLLYCLESLTRIERCMQ